MNEFAIQLEALLFALGRPLTRKELEKMLGVSANDIDEALKVLATEKRGTVIVDDGKTVELRASAAAAELIENVRKEEYSRDIGRAGLETLASILYRGPLTRSEVDFIRGVNSSQILRTLLMRGLIRRIPNPRDERSFLYEPTTELLSELGVSHRKDLPKFEETRKKLEELEAAYRAQEEIQKKEEPTA